MDGTMSVAPIVPTHLNGRHAFIYERVLFYIAYETREHKGIQIRKSQLAKKVGCSIAQIDPALRHLRRNHYIRVSSCLFDLNLLLFLNGRFS